MTKASRVLPVFIVAERLSQQSKNNKKELPQSLRPAEPPLSPFGLAPVH